ncbi:unnamed protein product [Prorocentrum cordatum]|uniref:Protein kinase domain-containing protein n=1 Tax=Prorocentrum cordatum TaxID=2364126 RepID=A0ABN9TKI7_9DINO|nr:unnamed protein product [Polarella glacialis]
MDSDWKANTGRVALIKRKIVTLLVAWRVHRSVQKLKSELAKHPELSDREQKQRWDELHRKNAKLALAHIRKYKGFLTKVGQNASTKTGELPQPWVEELKTLQDRLPVSPFREVRKTVREDLGRPLDEIFTGFEEKPFASASVAQAHSARLRDAAQTKVCVKVQHRGVAKLMSTDLGTVEYICRKAVRYHKETPDMRGLVGEWKRATTEEIDFKLEAKNAIRAIRALERGNVDCGCAEPIERCSGRRVLTMVFSEGWKITDVDSFPPGADRARICHELVKAFSTLAFQEGECPLAGVASGGRAARCCRTARSDRDVQGAPGTHLEIEVAPGARGRDLKRRVSRHLGVPCLYQALRAGGQAVEDEDALADHWLDRGAPLAVAVLGACGPEAPPGPPGPEAALRRAGFRPVALLPEGGEVYRIREAGGARDSFTAKAIGLSGMEQEARDTVLQEVALLRDLAPHPNLADCRRSFSDGGYCFLVTPCLDGRTLRAAVAEALSGRGAPCCTQAAAWAPQLLAGLAHLHGAGGVHRNLNPGSILLQNGDQNVVLTDFGISELLAEAASSRRAAAYMSPELLRNEPHGPWDDMWALGCTLYELCALVPPFEAPSLLDLAIRIIEGDPDWSAWEGPAPLQATARRLLARRPAERPSAAALLAEDAAAATAAVRRRARAPAQAWAETPGAPGQAAPSPRALREATGGKAGTAGAGPGAEGCCGGSAAGAKVASAARPPLHGRSAWQGTEPLVVSQV